MRYVLLSLAVAFNVASYVAYRAANDRPQGLAWALLFGAGLLLGLVNALSFTAALRDLSLGTAYPMFAGASIALLVLVSAWLFGEPVRAVNAAGAALVVVGIVLLTR